jgi:hypothetical protein
LFLLPYILVLRPATVSVGDAPLRRPSAGPPRPDGIGRAASTPQVADGNPDLIVASDFGSVTVLLGQAPDGGLQGFVAIDVCP